MEKFKIGDKIRMTETCGRYKKGQTFVVREKNGGPHVSKSGVFENCYHQKKWELASSTKPTKPTKPTKYVVLIDGELRKFTCRPSLVEF